MSSDGATLYLSAFIDELVRSGLKHIVVSPGSRSTPLAVLAAEHPHLQLWMNIDERSAAFFALGIAKAKQEAVALLCTSGTAAANYFPAITEANLSRVPLVVLTADRPHELRDVGAPQTINQLGLYGDHVKWFSEMPIPEASDLLLKHARISAARAVMTANSKPSGPVHLNFPLREPLLPNLEHPQLFGGGREDGQPYTANVAGTMVAPVEQIQMLARQLGEVDKGIIVCGPHDEPQLLEVVTALAKKLGYPIIADPLSQLRSGSHDHSYIVDSYDSFLRDEMVAATLEPLVIIRLGAMPVSKPLLQYMNRHQSSRMIVVDEAGWRDPTLLVSDRFNVHPVLFCKQLCEATEQLQLSEVKRDHSKWTAQWLNVNDVTRELLQQEVSRDHAGQLFEGTVVTELQALMDSNSTLFVGNSMPIRDVDSFFCNKESSIRILANRGANGIDGLVSTAIGISAVNEQTVLLIGDLSFYHDMNGLLAAKLHQLNITIVIVNNDGGGIFSFLPQAKLPNHFEVLFGTPTGLDYEYAIKMYGGQFQRVQSWQQFREAFQQAEQLGGLQVIEVPTNRELNVELHRQIWPRMSAKLAKLLS
ncbi:2-succinyl-5-enolpyruvyl-6-hydroxy-3-cyclohexene-1-carboxylic-acid synthase [Paenibacillus endoradicis]|uniref:2-succinyl-5-enolpyruvyl-6-hydroxy-3- cyclohexene-1-carboxylic-acid synthase n=1 Tax=Paenibacillus endoradicis TaxID=2972487 RepID=UPI002158CDCA|nr:2-succinyl-5-enolpyruvyl-6-hydroxy-3-cyclohexene-1-carboxylic-acid synthase [Paenibacillus endoradicis]MCR8658498.1 2-succinyl-5-enolpyruvyl-6-hydroxy-3-cyclohexene-1-carboxylic-acid synthase [Paenibacillus endoradicis]